MFTDKQWPYLYCSIVDPAPFSLFFGGPKIANETRVKSFSRFSAQDVVDTVAKGNDDDR